MRRKLSLKKTSQLVQDIIHARHDLTELAQMHGLSAEVLAKWINEPDNHGCLTGLCVLADIQTQLLLSRYRAAAATRLIQLATQEDKSDVARRACVDLLRTDLKSADSLELEAVEDEQALLPAPAAFYGQLPVKDEITQDDSCDDDENCTV